MYARGRELGFTLDVSNTIQGKTDDTSYIPTFYKKRGMRRRMMIFSIIYLDSRNGYGGWWTQQVM